MTFTYFIIHQAKNTFQLEKCTSLQKEALSVVPFISVILFGEFTQQNLVISTGIHVIWNFAWGWKISFHRFHIRFGWLWEFAALTKRKLLGLTITSVWAVLHTFHNWQFLTAKFCQNYANVTTPLEVYSSHHPCLTNQMYYTNNVCPFFWKHSLWIPGICFMNAQQIGSAWPKKDNRYWAVVPMSPLNSHADFQGYEKNCASAHIMTIEEVFLPIFFYKKNDILYSVEDLLTEEDWSF